MRSADLLAEATASGDPSAIYIGVAAIITAATGLVTACTALIKVFRSTGRRPAATPTPDEESST